MKLKWLKMIPLLLLAPLLAQGDTDADYVHTSEVQILTRAVPTSASFAAATALRLNLVNGFHVVVCAEDTRTLSGAGALDAYRYDERTGIVSRAPINDFAVNVTATSCSGAPCQCMSFEDKQLAQSDGWALFAAHGVTVSGGTTVTVHYFSYKKRR